MYSLQNFADVECKLQPENEFQIQLPVLLSLSCCGWINVKEYIKMVYELRPHIHPIKKANQSDYLIYLAV